MQLEEKIMQRKMKGKIILLLFTFTFAILGLIFVLGYIGIVKGDMYFNMALKYQTTDQIIPASRGSILDRNGNILAMSSLVYTVAIDPEYIKNNKQEQKVMDLFETILSMDKKSIQNKISQKNSYQVIQNEVSQEKIAEIRQKIKEKKIKGIILEPKSKRFYPNNIASHIAGFVREDPLGQVGLGGLELKYDSFLSGTAGRILGITDQQRKQIIDISNNKEIIEAKAGLTVLTTIDDFIQSTAKEVLEKTVKDAEAKKGTVILMDPNTGEVLAMASYPEFDNNNTDTWKNFAIHETYEPGSTFKVLPVAAALEDGAIKNTDQFLDKGYKIVENTRINSWQAGGFGLQTLTQVLENSSNVGVMDIVERLGVGRFTYYSHAFGLEEPTGIDLPGEAKGILHKENELNPVELATSSFGQTFQVTPLQMIVALGATINGGNLMRPYIAKEIRDANGNIVKKIDPYIIRQVISKQTSEQIRTMLRSVVKNGTGSNAELEGYRVGGKTGTSEKQPRELGLRIASFVGIAPAEDPKVIALMVIDEPGTQEKGGGAIAAPAIAEIFQKVLPYLGIEPIFDGVDSMASNQTITLANYTNMDLQQATMHLTNLNLQYKIRGVGDYVVNQYPKPGGLISENQEVILILGEKPITEKEQNKIEDNSLDVLQESTDKNNSVEIQKNNILHSIENDTINNPKP